MVFKLIYPTTIYDIIKIYILCSLFIIIEYSLPNLNNNEIIRLKVGNIFFLNNNKNNKIKLFIINTN